MVQNGAEGQLTVDLTAKFKEQYPDADEKLDKDLPKPTTDYNIR